MPTLPDKTIVKVSLETFNEIANALEATGKTINKDADIILTKDMSIKGPIDYRQVTIRKDVLEFVKDVYKAPMEDGLFEVSDSNHFINFFDDVYTYILEGKKPETKAIIDVQPKASSWGKTKE